MVATSLFLGEVSANSKVLDDKQKTTSDVAPNVSTTLVLSQVNGGGGGTTGTYLFDYVEIKNVSAVPQSLNGLSLYYGSAVGQFASTVGNAFALPNVSLNPGQYYMVQTGPTGTVGAAFPVTPDVITANLTMSGTSGKVALATAALPINTCGATATPCSAAQLALLVDWVAYGAAGNGTAGNGEGGTATNGGAAITSAQGNVRKTAGCTDTDNNNADFDVPTAPAPRNTSTALNPCSAIVATDAPVDFNGDGRTDYALTRNVGGGASGQLRWFYNLNNSANPTVALDWGLASDRVITEDFDGDDKDDIAVWRPAAATVAAFYILQSQTNTVRVEAFGQTGDDPTVVDDYNGDNRADLAVYRSGLTAGLQSTWFYRTTANGPVTYIRWGQNGDFPAPGDYDGNGSADFCIQRNNGGGQARFWTRLSTGVESSTVFGTPTDVVVPGDWDGDGKTDIATARGVSGAIQWHYLSSTNGSINYITFGSSATDFIAQGDYDGDGKTDAAIWRPSASANQSAFWSRSTTSGSVSVFAIGANGDGVPANYNTH